MIDKPVIRTDLTTGAGGTILDDQGRVICTMNLKKTGLSVSEAFAYVQLFILSAKHSDYLLNIKDEQ